MSPATISTCIQREPALLGQTVIVISGSAGIGLETARRAQAEKAKLILTGRNPERLERAAREIGALTSAAFDATGFQRPGKLFDELLTPIDHVLVTGTGSYFTPLAEPDIDPEQRTTSTVAGNWLRARERDAMAQA